MQDLVVAEKKVEDVLAEIEGAFFDVPFGNSDFQMHAFVIAAQQTPGRAYRAIGLELMSKINAVKEFIFSQEKMKIDLEELEYKIALDSTSEFDRRRHRLEITRLQSGQAWQNKLLNDQMHLLDLLYAEFKKFPRYDRAKFEGEEAGHFDARLKRQIERSGAVESLDNMHIDMKAMGALIEETKRLTQG
jgi:hypothetical protein